MRTSLCVLLASLCVATRLYGAPMSIDPTYGSNGAFQTYYVYFLGDGRLIYRDTSCCANGAAYRRADLDGKPDVTWLAGASVHAEGFSPAYSSAYLRNPDGRLILGGSVQGAGVLSPTNRAAPAVHYFDGMGSDFEFDRLFSQPGSSLGSVGERVSAIRRQSDGKILVLTERLNFPNASVYSAGLLRLMPDGRSKDPTFQPDAQSVSLSDDEETYDSSWTITELLGGEIRVDSYYAASRFYTQRDGSRSGPPGPVSLVPASIAPATTQWGVLATLSDGDRLVANLSVGGGIPRRIVARVRADGSLNTAFGGAGYCVIPFDASLGLTPATLTELPSRSMLSNDGARLYLVLPAAPAGGGAVIARLLVSGPGAGTLDSSFNDRGYVSLPWLPGHENIYDLAEQPDRALLVRAVYPEVVIRLVERGTPGAGMLYLERPAGTIGRSPAQINVRRAHGASGTISINYRTEDSTAKDGIDYTATSGTLTWLDGDAGTQTISVPVNTPVAGSTTRSFNVLLGNVSPGVVVLIPKIGVALAQSTPPVTPPASIPATPGTSGTATTGGGGGALDRGALLVLALLLARSLRRTSATGSCALPPPPRS